MLDMLKESFLNEGFDVVENSTLDCAGIEVSNGYKSITVSECEGVNEGLYKITFPNGTFEISDDAEYIKDVVNWQL